MTIKSDREYRNLGAFEIRANEEGKESYKVEGYATTFEPYCLYEFDGVKYYEQIDRHAFDDADISDVVFLLEHKGKVFARTKNKTVKLSIDDHGLKSEIDLSKTAGSREVAEDIKVGNYSQMSFAFKVAEDAYNRDTRTRVITKIKKVYDISAVAFPANPHTEIGLSARDYFNGVIEAEKAERLAKEQREAQIKRIRIMGGL